MYMVDIYISIIEIVYLFYMFYFFKTRINFNALWSGEDILNNFYNSTTNGSIFSKNFVNKMKNFFEHNEGEYIKICYFGRCAIIFLFIFLIARHFINVPKWFMILVLLTTFVLGLLNINSIVYLIPFYIIEIYRLFN